MPERVTKRRLEEFVEALAEAGTSCGNGRLRTTLGWDEVFYWKVQGQLVQDGRIIPGRGKGGSVRFLAAEGSTGTSEQSIEAVETTRQQRERPLYQPIKLEIESKWIERFGFDAVRVEETHSQGSKNTGGTFTRPDVTAVGVKQYVYLPKRIEVITFEIKPRDQLGIMGVLEAIAHREAAHRAYVVFAASRQQFDGSSEVDRAMELAQKYGVGIVLTEKPDQVDSWEVVLDAIRHEPDPARLDRFLGDLPSDGFRNQISKWK